MDKNDTHEFANYWNFKVTDAFFYTFEPHFFQRVNDFTAKMAKTITGKLPINLAIGSTETGCRTSNCVAGSQWNDYNREQYQIRLGHGIRSI
jgi:hypothetical protein